MQALDQDQSTVLQPQKTRRAKDSRDDNGQKNTSGQKSCGGFYKQTNQTRPKRLDSCTGTQVSSMRALVILPLLLCAVVCVDQVRAEVKAVKLCGREFLRAVVYTCGGSRWRRLLTESDMDGLPTGEQNSLESLSSSSSSSSSSSLGSELTRRDINNMLTTVCCQVGCRKSDLAFLC